MDRDDTRQGSEDGILNNPQVFALFMSAISENVTDKIRQRNESLRNHLIGILSAVIIAITAGGGLVMEYIAERAVRTAVDNNLKIAVQTAVIPAVEQAVGAAVDRAVDAAVKDEVGPAVQRVVQPTVEKAVDAVRFDSAIAALNFRVLSMDLDEGFTQEEAESVIQEIRLLYSQEEDIQRREKLRFSIITSVTNFAAANRFDLVVELESVAPDLIPNNSTVISAIVQMQAFTLLADAGAPRSWMDSSGFLREIYRSYRKYVDKANVAGYPELYLVHEMLLRYIEEVPKKEIDGLIEEAEALNEQDAEGFIEIMTSLATGTATTEFDVRSQRVSLRVKKFLCEFGERGNLLLEVSKNVRKLHGQVCV